MTKSPLRLSVSAWPETDRERWRSAQTPANFLEADKPASHWSPAYRRILEYAYGRWLGFLDRNEVLDPFSTPGARATEPRLREFVADLRDRVSSCSVLMMIGPLLRMLQVLDPERDWTVLVRARTYLKRTARPSRNKLACMVGAADLFDLGIWLMETCDHGQNETYRATRYRDGLLIALLISCPVRIKNLTEILIGRHLIFDGCNYRLKFTAAETKSGRPYLPVVPPVLTSYIDRYLQVHRPILQSTTKDRNETEAPDGHFWINRRGRPLSGNSIRVQIEFHTSYVFGKAIWPHLFRDCAVTELVDSAPEEIGIAHDLLGHGDLRTTRKHYLHARGMIAHTRVQEMIIRRRALASRRTRPVLNRRH
jgi:integrase/recombinase XerD